MSADQLRRDGFIGDCWGTLEIVLMVSVVLMVNENRSADQDVGMTVDDSPNGFLFSYIYIRYPGDGGFFFFG